MKRTEKRSPNQVYTYIEESYGLFKSKKNTRQRLARKKSTINPIALDKGLNNPDDRRLMQETDTKFVYKMDDSRPIRYDNYELYCKLYTLMVVQGSKGDSFMAI